MAFWGIEVIPDKPYIYLHDGKRGRLHVSQAILGDGSSKEKSQVECRVGEKKPIYICSLFPEKSETSPLNLEFDEHNAVMFKVIGCHSIHLSGFFTGESKYSFQYEFDYDTDESSEFDNEDKEIDDDADPFPSSPASNKEGKDIVDDYKPANEIGKPKQPKKKNQLSASDNNGNFQRKTTVKSGTSVPILESEDEDGFPITFPPKRKADVPNTDRNEGEIKGKEISEECKSNRAAVDPFHLKSLKRKVDAVVQDVEYARKTGKLLDASLPMTEAVADDDVKQKKKNLMKKPRGKGESTDEAGIGSMNPMQTEEATTTERDRAVPVGPEHDEKLIAEKNIIVDVDLTADENQSKKKKKKKGKSKKQESVVNANMEKTVTDENESNMEIEEKTDAKPSQVRSFPNGLVIEELSMGKPDGKKASPGKKVSVHYTGKLKKNGKIFDSNVGRAPFKFRLGVQQVIKGWDVGVNGMRVGDKRRLTIPPLMGYGCQGAGSVIPPNSWVVFDVKLVDVS